MAETKFVTVPLAELPKREPRGFDRAAADALLAAVTAAPDSGASDGAAYGTEAEARKIAQKHKRLLAHVAPKGQVARSRVFPVEGGFGWAVTLAEPSADKSKSAAKSK